MVSRRILVAIKLLATTMLGLLIFRYGLNSELSIVTVISWLLLIIIAICAFFSRAARIGGPEHRDPTETEIKAAKERYHNKYLDRL